MSDLDNLTINLQKTLDAIDSSVKLAETIDGTKPNDYAFFHPEKDRDFSVKISTSGKKHILSLSEHQRDLELSFQFYHFKGTIDSIERTAQLIKDWVDLEEGIDKISLNYPEIGRFEVYTRQHPNTKIEKYWLKVKNKIFRDYSEENEDYKERYYQMLDMAKMRQEWQNYYPFTSLNWLRFSLNEELTHTWELNLHMGATWTTEKGLYYVTIPKEENRENIFYFQNPEDTIEFYSQKLKEYNPIPPTL